MHFYLKIDSYPWEVLQNLPVELWVNQDWCPSVFEGPKSFNAVLIPVKGDTFLCKDI